MMSAPTVRAANLHEAVQKVDSRLQGLDVAWTDNARGTVGGMLTCWGKNITDMKLRAEFGNLPMIRSPNHDELLGPIDAGKVHCGGVTFEELYASLEDHICYMGHKLSRKPALKKVVMRFQCAFVGLHAGQKRNLCVETYSYQTRDAKDPRNLLLVVTPTGVYVHTDGVGYTKLLAHIRENGKILSNWFEAEESACADGAPQKKKAAKLGVEGCGDQSNRMLVFSIPLKQREVCSEVFTEEVVYRSLSAPEVGKCSAARLNVGAVYGEAATSDMELEVDDTEQITCTQLDWKVLVSKAGEVTISEADAKLVAKEIMQQYACCDAMCKLSELDACLHELETKHLAQIAGVAAH
jgi:hypothetical protein